MADSFTPPVAPVATPAAPTATPAPSVTSNAPVAEIKAELQEALTDPTLTPSEKKEVKAKIKELTLKVDGKVIKEKLPFEVDADNKEMIDYLTKELQMSKMSHNRSKYAKTLEDEISQFFTALKNDPESVLSNQDLGIDLEKLATKVIEKKIENSKKTPEQLEKEKMAEELKALRDEREKEKEENKKRKVEMDTKAAYENYEQGIIKAIESTKDLPKSAYVIKKFANYLEEALDKGYDLSPEDVLPLVKEEIHNDIKQMFEASPDDLVEKMLTKDRLTKMRKSGLEKARAAVAASSPLKQVKEVASETKDENRKKIPMKDFFKL